MRVFLSSTPAELEPHQAAACDVVHELGLRPMLRDPAAGHGLDPVKACARQVASADLMLAIVGWRRGRVPAPELGGDGLKSWFWWELRGAFDRDIPVAVLMASEAWRPDLREEDPRGRAEMRDIRGELDRLAVFFEDDDDGLLRFRELVRSRLLEALRESDHPARGDSCSGLSGLRLRQWPRPELPERPYPSLLPYTHPDLMAGRESELGELRHRLRQPVPIVGLYASSGTGKSSLLAGGLVPALRAEAVPVAFERHPSESGLAARLIGDLFESEEPEAEDPHAFADRLMAAGRLSGRSPVLVLDQFEDLLRHDDARRARAAAGTLLAASVQRRHGALPLCRWLLAYRREYHGRVVAWLGDVLRDARAKGLEVETLPHDLARPERFQGWSLKPLATPLPGTADPVEEAARIFLSAIEKPLGLRDERGDRRYPWRFAGAERLARAFGEARIAQPEAPLGPELQVVLAHLLENAVTDGSECDTGVRTIEVPEAPAELIDQALEKHLYRALDAAFPLGRHDDGRIRRTRALLVLRELAELHGRREDGLPAELMVRALGDPAPEARRALDQLATAATRLVLLEQRGGEWVYVLAHDRLAQLVVRLVDEELLGGLGVDADLPGLRRFVSLQSQLFASGDAASGDASHATAVPESYFQQIRDHAEALLWGEEVKRWWQACLARRRRDRRRKRIRGAAAAMALVLVALAAWIRAGRQARHRALLDQVARGEPEAALETLEHLAAAPRAKAGELTAALRRRARPLDVIDSGLGGVEPYRRGEVLLRVAPLFMPILEDAPEDPMRIAPMVWALDFFAVASEASRNEALTLRDRVLEPLRRSRPPPLLPEPGDPAWVDVPAGSFLMGSGPGEGRDAQEKLDERPRHQVTISAFRMMALEVTTGEFRRLFPDHTGTGPDGGPPDPDTRPARWLTWFEAYTYAAWLGGRLATEPEWEYAARAGCAYAYCRHDGSEATLDDVAWWLGQSGEPAGDMVVPQRGGQLEPNPWGLYDMYGNVWEWNADWYGAYPSEPRSDPTGATSNATFSKNFRGGSVFETADWVGAPGRGADAADGPGAGIGLRVILTPITAVRKSFPYRSP